MRLKRLTLLTILKNSQIRILKNVYVGCIRTETVEELYRAEMVLLINDLFSTMQL